MLIPCHFKELKMKYIKYKLKEISTVELSGVDKKTMEGEKSVHLCNFVDVYYNWAITKELQNSFMEATANETEIERFKIKKGQVALTKDSETRDDIGISTYIADDFDNVILGYHNALVTPHESVLYGKYLNLLFHTNYAKKYFTYNASGSGQRYALSVEVLNSFPVYLPNIKEQKKISNIFSLIDRKIKLNHSINHNLEAMAKQLYDYWFVQFDFPNEEGKPYKSSGGKMVWDKKIKREIPEGWHVISVFDELDVQYGFPFSTESFIDKPTLVPVVRIRDILDNSVSAYSLEEADDKYLLHKQDLLIGMDGNFHMNYWSDNISYLNQRSVRLRAKNNSNVSIVQAKFDIQPYIKAKELNAKGSTVGHLSDEDMKELQVLVCPSFVPKRRMDAILGMIISNRDEIQNLTKLRDELLPLLMNGQVSVNYDLSND